VTELQKTPLYALHLELGAKMTAFAGYAMPVQYPKGILHEHSHCRAQAGFFDISHMGQCRLLGDQAPEFLEGLTPGGISDLQLGAQKYTVLTNGQGGIIDDIIVTRIDGGLAIVVNAACKDKDFAYLRKTLPVDLSLIEDADLALLALQGPEARTVLAEACPPAGSLAFMRSCNADIAGVDCVISCSGYTGEDGFEISVPASEAEQIARLLLNDNRVLAVGLGARDTLRLEAGLSLYGHELSETISPIEAGLQWLLKKGHSGFPGADIILAQKQQGPPRIKVGLQVSGKIPVRDGCQISDANDRIAGKVTSGGFSPSLKRPIAMALVDKAVSITDTQLCATVHGQTVALAVCDLPFIPHRYRR
jgi:aminomethyltransferase